VTLHDIRDLRNEGLRTQASMHLQMAQNNAERTLKEITRIKRSGLTGEKAFTAFSLSEAATEHLMHCHRLMQRHEQRKGSDERIS